MSCNYLYSCSECSRNPDCVWYYSYDSWSSCMTYSDYYNSYYSNGYIQYYCDYYYSSLIYYRYGLPIGFTIGLSVFWGLYIVFGAIIGACIWRKRRRSEGIANVEVTLNDPINMDFDKTFNNNDDDGLTKLVKCIYKYSRLGIFNFLSIFLGSLFAMLWGYIVGVIEFELVWFLFPFTNIIKKISLPAAKIAGDIMNNIFGSCLKNFKTEPTSFIFGNSYQSQNDLKHIKPDILNTQNDSYRLPFVTAFPNSGQISRTKNCEKTCYDVCRIGGYYFLTAVIGIPLSLIWGLIYGCLQFIITWILNPAIEITRICTNPCSSVVGKCMNEIYGKCFRNMRSEGYHFEFNDIPVPVKELQTKVSNDDIVYTNNNNIIEMDGDIVSK